MEFQASFPKFNIIANTVRYWGQRQVSKPRARNIAPFLTDSKSVLDVGMGLGLTAEVLVSLPGISIVHGLDIEDRNITDIPLTLYNGKMFPFATNSFDSVVISCTLHHCSDSDSVLKEARRVARKYVIVIEDTPRNKLEWLLCALHAKRWKMLHSRSVIATFHSKQRWEKIFIELSFNIVSIKKSVNFRAYIGNPVRRTVFVLEKKK